MFILCVLVGLVVSSASSPIFSCDPLLAPIRCGVPKLHPNSLPSRPSEAIRGEFPWHAALYQEESGNFSYSCGGSLINERFVLTAAHCVINPNNGYKLTVKRLKVLLGGHLLGVEDECVQHMKVKRIYVHDQYKLGEYKHDIAVVEILGRVIFTQRVVPICVDLSESEDSHFYKHYGKVPGWGYTEYDAVSNWLRMTELPFVNYTTCLASNPELFSHTIFEGMFCAGYANGTSVCNGDSGGGLVSFNRDHWLLQGIVSFTALRDGEDVVCDSKEYAGFTKVRYYRNWLNAIFKGEEIVDHAVLPIAKKKEVEKMESGEEELDLGPCGERKINKQYRIVNGVRSYSGEWPWHVAVYEVDGRTKRYICGGTLISDQFVLTAAHCMLNDAMKQRSGIIVVQLGQNDLFESSVTMREVRVTKVTPHEQFNPHTKTNDVALLELSSNVQFNDYIQPACLPTKQTTSNFIAPGTMGTVVGWGYQQPWSFMISNTLQATRLPIVDQTLCVIGEKQAVEMDGILCVGSKKGSNACTGDSGGGIFFDNGGVWTVGGVISALDTTNGFCNPDGYLKVSSIGYFRKWIKQAIKSGLQEIKGTGDRVMTFLQTATDNPTPPNSPATFPCPTGESHVHHHHHHHYHRHDQPGDQERSNCNRGHSGSSESNESGLKAPIKKIFKKKKCFIKDLTSSLLKLF
ncbi:transmembrane protease serine 9-like [Wyeomyia smithii]|uniref:transmembrane protease serine 9-like n=1 Tax=Wyeomyia smithii TaxID=174621 RepID=UPI002468039F|nr:transmembrane protease serine 9-like [Wyeomyia smithii]